MRKSKEVVIQIPGRDQGKKFILTEMSARQAERWADRAWLELAHSAIDLPPGIERGGMSGIAEIARLMGNLKFPELAPLMDELLGCVQIVPDPSRPLPRPLMDSGAEGDDIEEVSTRQLLRQEVCALHLNFSLAAKILELMAAASELKMIPVSGTTSTLTNSSELSSVIGSPPFTN